MASQNPAIRSSNPATAQTNAQGMGNRLAFDSIDQPGSYICNWSGHLLRVPNNAVQSGQSPNLSISGAETTVTKISDDPYISVSKARMLAADLDQTPNF